MSAAKVGESRSACPIAKALDILGDKWTLLVIRDLLFFDKHRFSELAASAEGIPTNLLADRLARLCAAGLVERRAYQTHPPRDEYHLTERGRGLQPVLRELAAWTLGRPVVGPPRSAHGSGT